MVTFGMIPKLALSLTHEIIGFVKTFSYRNHTWLLITFLLLSVVLCPLSFGPVLPLT